MSHCGLIAAKVSSYCRRSAAVSSLGSIVVAPIALRIWRIDLRMASRRARLAFSIRCQRSATCIACGRAPRLHHIRHHGHGRRSKSWDEQRARLGRLRAHAPQRNDPAPFEVADNAGVSVIAPPGPIINANNPRAGQPADGYGAQERVRPSSILPARRSSTRICRTSSSPAASHRGGKGAASGGGYRARSRGDCRV